LKTHSGKLVLCGGHGQLSSHRRVELHVCDGMLLACWIAEVAYSSQESAEVWAAQKCAALLAFCAVVRQMQAQSADREFQTVCPSSKCLGFCAVIGQMQANGADRNL